jgi:hypothetical protein
LRACGRQSGDNLATDRPGPSNDENTVHVILSKKRYFADFFFLEWKRSRDEAETLLTTSSHAKPLNSIF